MGIRLLTAVAQTVDMTGMQQQIADAKAQAQAAQDASANARQMVLNRDPAAQAAATSIQTLTSGQQTLAQQQASLEQLATTLGAAIPAADATHAQMNARMATIETAATALTRRVTALEGLNAGTRLTALEARTLRRDVKTVTTTAAVVLGGSIDVTCTWDTPFPDASYTPIVDLDATGLMLSTVGPAWKAQTATSVTVTVKALVAVAAGVKIRFVGLRWG